MVSKYWKIALLYTLTLTTVTCNNNISREYAEKRNIPIEFHNGDIVFRRGSGATSRAVLHANHRGSFSHVGVAMNIGDKWMVIHSVPYEGASRDDDKIHVEPVEDFFNSIKASSGAVYRLSHMDSTQQKVICSYLESQIINETPFDHKYDLTDSTMLYCSELVWRSYLKIGVDITDGNRTKVSLPGFKGLHITPADIEYNSDLELIYRF